MIYLHVPFCHRKCTYCAFHSKPVVGGRWPVASYVDALLAEMELRRGEQPHAVRTVYFGGGTPSILPLNELGRIVEALHRCFDLSQLEEFTFEANPEDLTPDYLAGLRLLGINRLSVGIQSLDDTMLRLLNRRHTARQALEALENARRAGFDNLSADFIYGLPRWNFQFSVFNFQLITHLSAYALTVEPGTALDVQVRQGRAALPDDEEVVRQYHALRQQFEGAGFRQYEVSNYARPGFESVHNSRYWDRTPYLGLGPGAHSFDGRRRRWNLPDNQLYISTLTSSTSLTSLSGSPSPYFEEETISPADAFNELLMTSLRTVRGLSLFAVPQEYRAVLHKKLQPYVACGWLTQAPKIQNSEIKIQNSELRNQNSELLFRPTPEGLLHADGMATSLFV